MNIVIEGHDNSGKSTLAAKIGQRIGREVIIAQGPQQYHGELEERVASYAEHENVVFDRHPCISDPIYSMARGKPTPLSVETIRAFYQTPTLIIYCDPGTRGLGIHVAKTDRVYDTPAHMAMVESHYSSILAHYRQWAIERAHVTYRIGDDEERIIRICEDFDPVRDVDQFMEKFGQSYSGVPRALPTGLAQFREDFMREELDEYVKHTRHLQALLDTFDGLLAPADNAEIAAQLEEQLDGIIDLLYVAIGTGRLHGFNLREAWRRVHVANMKKEKVASRDQSTRHSLFDVRKPPGWEKPSHIDLVEGHAHRRS